jgi:hypothetical protein
MVNQKKIFFKEIQRIEIQDGRKNFKYVEKKD